MKKEFVEIVKETFSFLEVKYGYKCVHEFDYIIEYRSDKVIIEIRYDKRASSELVLSFGLLEKVKTSEEPLFTLSDLLGVKKTDEREKYYSIQISDENLLEKYLNKISDMLLTYGKDIFVGNDEIFISLENLRIKEAKEYTLEIELDAIREKANYAWNDKDYRCYYDLMHPFSNYLQKSELKKIQYSLKKINGD